MYMYNTFPIAICIGLAKKFEFFHTMVRKNSHKILVKPVFGMLSLHHEDYPSDTRALGLCLGDDGDEVRRMGVIYTLGA